MSAIFSVLSMDKKSISYLIVVLAIATMSGSTIWALSYDPLAWRVVDTPPPRRSVSANDDRIFQNDIYNFRITVPAGWYLHERFDGAAVLTKKERQVIPKSNETWSIGEQIVVSVADMTTSVGKNPKPEKWIAKNVPTQDIDGQPIKKSWEELGGNRLLKVEQMAGSTGDYLLTYYAFRNSNVISFTLFPYDPTNALLQANLRDFETIIGSLSFVGLSDQK